MARPAPPTIILGAGYAGLATWHVAHRRARGRWPVLLVDRHPVHVLRTELYQLDRLAASEGALSRWAIPLRQALRGAVGSIRTGTVQRIDLTGRSIEVDGTGLEFGELAICLGSVPAYYGVPGAESNCFDVYRLSDAAKLAEALRHRLSRPGAGRSRVRVVVVGGGSTGTEVAAEIATARWSRVVGRAVEPPEVTLVAGRLPFLAGLPDALVPPVREMLQEAGVRLDEGRNVRRVTARAAELDDGEQVPFDLAVWAAGVQAPPVVRQLPGEHGHSGRIRVDDRLQVGGVRGVLALGDAAEVMDAATGAPVPATAQAALAAAPIAGHNLIAHRLGGALRSFRYREKGVIVALGVHAGAGRLLGLSVWGRTAALIKAAVEQGHRFAAERGGTPPGL